MNLSNTLFNTVTKKLKLNTFSLQEEKFYIKNLLYKTEDLKKITDNNLKLKLQRKSSAYETTNIIFIINISFLKANTFVHVSNAKGETLIFFSAGQVNLKGKQKKNRKIAINKLLALLNKKANFIGKHPIAVHLNNVKSYKFTIVNKLKQFYWVKILKSFNQTPYNGCRKSKIRRKKFTKKFK